MLCVPKVGPHLIQLIAKHLKAGNAQIQCALYHSGSALQDIQLIAKHLKAGNAQIQCALYHSGSALANAPLCVVSTITIKSIQ